jgi:lipopolysaccharide export system permease protein
MIFHRALLREFAGAAVATFLVLLGILLTTQMVRLLGQAAGGDITSTSVAALLALTSLSLMPVLLSLTLFIAILMTLTRSYRDSEMIVWFSGGISLTGWLRPVLVFALPLVCVIALLAMWLSPWAAQKSEELRLIMDSRDEAATIAPGVFRESRQAQRVFFVEAVSGGGNQVANVFVSSAQHGKHGIMVARRGYLETAANGDRFLVLVDGRRYEGEPGNADYKIYHFERYAMRVEAHEAVRAPSVKMIPTGELLQDGDPRNQGEFVRRMGLPVSALILALLAIPLSFVNPRAGRSLNLVLAVLIYMVYNNVISITQAAISQSKLGFVLGAVGIHLFMLGLLLLLFYRRLSVFSVVRMFK